MISYTMDGSAAKLQTYANKGMQHMKLRERTRKPARLPDKRFAGLVPPPGGHQSQGKEGVVVDEETCVSFGHLGGE
jgi:hypothetical protein